MSTATVNVSSLTTHCLDHHNADVNDASCSVSIDPPSWRLLLAAYLHTVLASAYITAPSKVLIQ